MSAPNEPAFPWVCSEELRADGMTIREYFAGQAIMGILANSDIPDLLRKGFAPIKAAEIAYEVADAMIEAGRKTR